MPTAAARQSLPEYRVPCTTRPPQHPRPTQSDTNHSVGDSGSDSDGTVGDSSGSSGSGNSADGVLNAGWSSRACVRSPPSHAFIILAMQRRYEHALGISHARRQQPHSRSQSSNNGINNGCPEPQPQQQHCSKTNLVGLPRPLRHTTITYTTDTQQHRSHHWWQ